MNCSTQYVNGVMRYQWDVAARVIARVTIRIVTYNRNHGAYITLLT